MVTIQPDSEAKFHRRPISVHKASKNLRISLYASSKVVNSRWTSTLHSHNFDMKSVEKAKECCSDVAHRTVTHEIGCLAIMMLRTSGLESRNNAGPHAVTQTFILQDSRERKAGYDAKTLKKRTTNTNLRSNLHQINISSEPSSTNTAS